MERIRLVLYADYTDWPLWLRPGGNLREGAVPLTAALTERIKAWFNAYDDGDAHPGWPMWRAPDGLEDPDDEEEAWAAEGEAIAAAIQAELGDAYEVTFEA